MAATHAQRRGQAQSISSASGSHLAVRHFTALDAAFAGVLALMVASSILDAILARGWVTAVVTDVVVGLCLFAMAANPAWRPLMLRLLAIGLVAGVIELFTDFAGERVAHSLVYPTGEPMLLASPAYMPLSWTIVLTQLGYLGWRLAHLAPPLRIWQATLLTALAGAVTVPFYEEMAYYAGWWQYTPALRIGHTPVYVLIFEAGIAALLPLILRDLPGRGPGRVALLGVAVGAWMPVVALIAWLVLGR